MTDLLVLEALLQTKQTKKINDYGEEYLSVVRDCVTAIGNLNWMYHDRKMMYTYTCTGTGTDQ